MISCAYSGDDCSVISVQMIICEAQLADGAVPSNKVKALAKARGITESTLKRAKESLSAPAEKTGDNGSWMWLLPEAVQNDQEDQPDHDGILDPLDHLESG